jgi:hypothetical protein
VRWQKGGDGGRPSEARCSDESAGAGKSGPQSEGANVKGLKTTPLLHPDAGKEAGRQLVRVGSVEQAGMMRLGRGRVVEPVRS